MGTKDLDDGTGAGELQPRSLAAGRDATTDPKRSEEALRESRNLLQTVLDTIPARIFWKDRALRYLGCNRPFARDAGLEAPEELVGKDDFQMGWREQAELYRRDDREVLERGEPKLNYEEPQTTPDGRRLWLRTNKAPLRSADGEILGVLGTYEDITAQKRAEAALRQAALIVENSPVLLFRWEAREGWPIALVSHNVVQLGYTPEELLAGPVPFTTMVHPDDRERVAREVEGYVALGADRFQQEYRILTRDGQPRWVDDRTVVERDGAGRITHFQGILVDITERRQLEQRLLQAQRLESVGKLAGGVAHDFNNILAVIVGYGEALRAAHPHDARDREAVDGILEAAERAGRLTRGLLAFSRQQVIAPREVDLRECVRSAEKFLARMMGEGVELATELGPDPLVVRADVTQLEQVLMNLAANARDAMPRGGRITITASRAVVGPEIVRAKGQGTPGPHAVLVVRDTGAGMDEETQARMFDPFFTTKEPGKGTGLGLATVYGIVSQSGGHIEVASGIGEGTTLRIYLPLARGRPAPDRSSPAPGEPVTPPT